MESCSVLPNSNSFSNSSVFYQEAESAVQSLCGLVVSAWNSETNNPAVAVDTEDLNPYKCSLESGAFDFWADEDDIYGYSDG